MNPIKRFFSSSPNSAAVPDAIRGATAGMIREAEKDRTISTLSYALAEVQALEKLRIRNENQSDGELEEAMAMAGAGPWHSPAITQGADGKRELRENVSALQGAFGDTELMLQNIGWRRELNLNWLEFSRWGINSIILISRLYYIKNPLIQRGINVSALYVFGRGFEVSSPDADANEVLRAFWERNAKTIGQSASVELEKRKFYDGNLFFVFFVDRQKTGEANVRTIDATEIQEIVSDPDDSETPRFYRREWIQREFNTATGAFQNVAKKAWYPDIDYDPEDAAERVDKIAGVPVNWDNPILHRKCGGVAKWAFGCPLVYAAIDWAKAAKRFLESCMTIRDALAQFALIMTTKGGQAAMQGAKDQLSTTVGPAASLWDSNPPAGVGSTFISGPGTKMEAFNTKGAGGDPGEVREYKLMCAMVFGIPESFFADMNTSNLATATSLDRPTQLLFMEKQETWREDYTKIARKVLLWSSKAVNSGFREALEKKGDLAKVRIYEARRVMDAKGLFHYEVDAAAPKTDIQILVNFPAIIEADVPAQVSAVVEAMTLGNKQGAIVGIDEREGARLLYQLVGTENADELLEAQYPSEGVDEYDPLRTGEPEPAAAPVTDPTATPAAVKEAELAGIKGALARLARAIKLFEAAE